MIGDLLSLVEVSVREVILIGGVWEILALASKASTRQTLFNGRKEGEAGYFCR